MHINPPMHPNGMPSLISIEQAQKIIKFLKTKEGDIRNGLPTQNASPEHEGSRAFKPQSLFSMPSQLGRAIDAARNQSAINSRDSQVTHGVSDAILALCAEVTANFSNRAKTHESLAKVREYRGRADLESPRSTQSDSQIKPTSNPRNILNFRDFLQLTAPSAEKLYIRGATKSSDFSTMTAVDFEDYFEKEEGFLADSTTRMQQKLVAHFSLKAISEQMLPENSSPLEKEKRDEIQKQIKEMSADLNAFFQEKSEAFILKITTLILEQELNRQTPAPRGFFQRLLFAIKTLFSASPEEKMAILANKFTREVLDPARAAQSRALNHIVTTWIEEKSRRGQEHDVENDKFLERLEATLEAQTRSNDFSAEQLFMEIAVPAASGITHKQLQEKEIINDIKQEAIMYKRIMARQPREQALGTSIETQRINERVVQVLERTLALEEKIPEQSEKQLKSLNDILSYTRKSKVLFDTSQQVQQSIKRVSENSDKLEALVRRLSSELDNANKIIRKFQEQDSMKEVEALKKQLALESGKVRERDYQVDALQGQNEQSLREITQLRAKLEDPEKIPPSIPQQLSSPVISTAEEQRANNGKSA